MEPIATLPPPASHCIKCFCNFIRILCLCRCHSAVKLKSKTEILHFHPQWKLRKSIFMAGKEPTWPCQLGHSLFRLEGSLQLASWKRGRKEALNLLVFSGNLTNKWSPWFKDGELQCNPIFFLLSLSDLRLCWRSFSSCKGQKFQQNLGSKMSVFWCIGRVIDINENGRIVT